MVVVGKGNFTGYSLPTFQPRLTERCVFLCSCLDFGGFYTATLYFSLHDHSIYYMWPACVYSSCCVDAAKNTTAGPSW